MDSTGHTPDPYAVLGVPPGAGRAEITAAYRRALRACHPDTAHPDRDRLARVIAAYRRLRDRESGHKPSPGTPIRVRVHDRQPVQAPDLRAGPVRRHPSR